ncbi:UDP-N-acetylmuramoyl-L-alanyl-D-glutamate--2,6-diaminopimelate ligase [Fulvitalea axinellae]|uniref:UDP-N-acetylmuramoyl-L-alanyl-D-glutamate--2,6-diaminopimelate ligase n=2 Tax=Fulvitalea axinellae TaxID=1182444 RepID=A0AAU9DFN9_9BACT|nr:UDP-N-acetylmuramoyl-L-alanyl-D-glutamate--2,6-diaminopimelate ligase [Fulvitalea axinellae]
MRLEGLLSGIKISKRVGTDVSEIGALHFDSRKVESGDVFFAVPGTRVDGHDYIEKALEKGASVIVLERMPEKFKDGVLYLKVSSASEALGKMASAFYGNPSKELKLVGVTGTNGKTSVVTLLYRLFSEMGYASGMLSTVVNKIADREIPATHTTGDALQINRLLREMADSGVTHCFMEVSSHAIEQDRVAGLDFDGAVFMNITHDHLDYHGTFRKYIDAKKKLFDGLPKSAFGLVNSDDKRGNFMLQNCKGARKTFAVKNMADFKAKIVTLAYEGMELDIEGQSVWFRLTGKFNAYNLLAVYAVATLLGEEQDEALRTLTGLKAAPGRFEAVPNQTGITAIVDYAHTPDALENVLSTIEGLRKGDESVLTVVGCGGDRDKTKRPEMAKIAVELSDKVILTSDNPRSEDPEAILADMKAGVPKGDARRVLSITDRKEAIRTAIMMAKPGDVILVAGKGHETYQEVNGVRYDFDDRKVLGETFGES